MNTIKKVKGRERLLNDNSVGVCVDLIFIQQSWVTAWKINPDANLLHFYFVKNYTANLNCKCK